MDIPKIRMGGLPQEGTQEKTQVESRTTGFSGQDVLESADRSGIIDDGDLFQLPGLEAGIIVVDGGITGSPQLPGEDAGIIIVNNWSKESE